MNRCDWKPLGILSKLAYINHNTGVASAHVCQIINLKFSFKK